MALTAFAERSPPAKGAGSEVEASPGVRGQYLRLQAAFSIQGRYFAQNAQNCPGSPKGLPHRQHLGLNDLGVDRRGTEAGARSKAVADGVMIRYALALRLCGHLPDNGRWSCQ